MPKQLPSHPNLENLKKQARQLVKEHQAGQVEAFARIKAYFPSLADASVSQILKAEFSLCNAQLVIAREYGFATWPKLSSAVEAPSVADKDALLDVNPGLRWIEDQVALLAPTELPVLICGENGTGKALAARTIHQLSPRKDGPFLQVNCDRENATLIDSELFGHEEGAFTGARAQRAGKIELAQGGTLFLDQFISLPPDLQAKLFVLLKEGTFERVGGVETLQADVRIITATHANLDALVREGHCRNDLVLLLRRAIISMPSLREKREAIPELAAYFAGQMAEQLDKPAPDWSQKALEDLSAYDWPGNVAELAMRVQRAVVSCGDGAIRKDDLILN